MSQGAAPLISVITATCNAAAALPVTITSLRAQTSSAFEWLVADAASTDGTVDLLRENQKLISWWVSEPDAGIYDAWNKACCHARGEWLLFLGAGDELAGADTLEVCAVHLHALATSTCLAYGRQLLLRPDTHAVIEVFGVPWQDIRHKWEIGRPALPPHGATFHRRTLFAAAQPFDLRFSIAADSHFLLRHIRACPPAFLPLDITHGLIGGVSFRLDTARQVSREITAINRDLGLSPPVTVRVVEAVRLLAISILNCLPLHVSHRAADFLRSVVGKPGRWSAK